MHMFMAIACWAIIIILIGEQMFLEQDRKQAELLSTWKVDNSWDTYTVS